jgi:1-deoxy-D-xylulose-5-phosphate synthase
MIRFSSAVAANDRPIPSEHLPEHLMDFSHLKLTHLPRLHTPADLRRLPISALPEVAAEIRRAICDQISRSGGHLAPNLGVVELTIALHYVFDFGHDRLLFDVGHQCYPHKLLTGRLPLLGKLRLRRHGRFPRAQRVPLRPLLASGTPAPASRPPSAWPAATRSTAKASPEKLRAAAASSTIIGDASIVNGVAMEGLNNAGTLKRQFLVVLNDNGMSIAKPQGAVAAYFDKVRLSHSYGEFKKAAKEMLAKVPGGDLMREAYHRMGEASKAIVSEDAWFEHFGLVTVGPVDGHDIPTLIQVLNEAKDTDRPLVLHVKTIKGKGYSFAEGDSTTFHSPSPFSMSDMESEGCRVELKKSSRSFTGAFGEMLADLMARDPKVVACTAAMPDGTGLSKVMPKFPDRTWDTGICESHALDMMAGLAKTGWKPFFAVYSTFLQRAFDQCFQEVSLQGLAVRLCLDRAGLVGGDGAVHHGFCDVSILRCLPKACLMAAIDEPSLKASLEFMRFYDQGLSSVRYPRDSVSQRFVDEPCPPFELGKARALLETERPHVAVLAFGTPAIDACEAADLLAGEYRVNVYDARFAKPVDIGLVRSLLERGIPIITAEDHSIEGGFGSCVLDACNDEKLDTRLITRLALPDSWIYQGERKEQLAEAGLDAAGIARAIRAAVDAHGAIDAGKLDARPSAARA